MKLRNLVKSTSTVRLGWLLCLLDRKPEGKKLCFFICSRILFAIQMKIKVSPPSLRILAPPLDKSRVNSNEVHQKKKKILKAEQLERSTISQEHGEPVLTESLSYSSDGTQSKTKRIRIEQCPSNGNCCSQGTVLRFRLKGREHENVQPSDGIPSTSVVCMTNITKMFNACPVKDDESGVAAAIPAPDKDIEDINPLPAELMGSNATPAAHGNRNVLPICSSSGERVPKKPKSAYETLLCELVPPPKLFEVVAGNDDEQWLLNSCKKQASLDMRSQKACDGVSGRRSLSIWPHGHLLPEADLYSLPFTVPF